jgi:polysaccharide deacetylase family protein (PEP-CTERM system associated)
MSEVRNIVSVDVEEWFQVEAFASHIPRTEWDRLERRARRNIETLLELFERYRVKCTFFVLGWLAERDPELVREMAAAGHEIASHGWSHRPVWNLDSAQFLDEVKRSKQLLEELSGAPVLGYRAPTFSITKKTLWALGSLRKAGYSYDSSIFPVIHDRYGIPDALLEIHRHEAGIWEIPMSVMELWRYRLPIAGGGYFRLYPYAVSRRAIAEMNAKERPAIIYLHPWEFDPDQPRPAGIGMVTRFRHYSGIRDNLAKLERLLNDFAFTTAGTVLNARSECCDPDVPST